MGKIKGFYELSKSLPLTERKELYEKILRSLNLKDDSEDTIYRPGEGSPDQHELIIRDIQAMGIWERFIFWLKRLFSSKSYDEAFIELKLSRLKSRIRRTGEIMYIHDPPALTGEFAVRLYQLYRTVYPVVPLFRTVWHDKEFFQRMINYLLENTIPGAKTEVYDFIPKQDLEDLMIKDDTKGMIRRELKRQISTYLESIPPDVFAHLESGLMPLYLLKYLVLFPFPEVLSIFLPGGTIDRREIPEETPPDFRNISASAVIDFLESLYFALYAVSKLQKEFVIHKELITYYVENLENTGVDNSYLTKGIKTFLYNIQEGAYSFRSEVPLTEIIKVYREDPYFKFLAYLPRINLKEFYASALVISMFSQLEDMLPQIRKGVVDKLKAELFHYPLSDFEFYRRSAQSTIKKLGLPTFKYVKSLNILYNFLRRNYRHSIQDFVAVVDKIIPVRFRDLQRRMRSSMADLSDLTDRIRDFDYTFSPETEDGKNFYRIRYSVEKDISQQKIYRMLVAQKDREAKQLLNRGRESLTSLETVLSDLKEQASEQIQERYSSFDPVNPESIPFKKAAEKEINSISIIKSLIDQLQAMEEGR
jgi:hypothetical protein